MFEAAINRLKEELAVVTDVRSQLLNDHDLKAAQPAHHRSLLVQTRAEVAQLARAITLLERVQSGELAEVELPPLGRSVPPAALPALDRPRDLGLVRRPVLDGGAR